MNYEQRRDRRIYEMSKQIGGWRPGKGLKTEEKEKRYGERTDPWRGKGKLVGEMC